MTAAAAASAAPFEVRVKQWHAVGAWTWGAGDADDVCGICRNPYDGCPPDAKYPGDDSPVVWGTCGHAFHLQCVTKWLAAQAANEQRCPICRRPWEFKSADESAARQQQQQQVGGGSGQATGADLRRMDSGNDGGSGGGSGGQLDEDIGDEDDDGDDDDELARTPT
jgi:anaphase-promoting complex subunit 11